MSGSFSAHVVVLALLCSCATTPKPPLAAPTGCVAFEGGTVIASPEAEPLPDATVVACDGAVVAVGPRASVQVPAGARRVDASGTTVVAAFWNLHVHLTERAFASEEPELLAREFEDLATRWGFARVVDLGSDPRNTARLRRALSSGEVRGPELRVAAGPFIAVDAQPRYVPVPLPQLRSPEQAQAMVNEALDDGAVAIKLMTASVVAKPPSPVMPVEVVRAVTQTAHARKALVFAHPTNFAGVEAARLGGVDILAHTAPEEGPWSAEQARALVAAKVSLVPTLSLWRREIDRPAVADRFELAAVEQVKAFAAAGGELLFGTDVGYRPERDPGPEYALLTRAGLSWRAQLAMLTTAPARRFSLERIGQVVVGDQADLVVLEADPRSDPLAFTRVRCTFLRGRLLHGDARCGPAAP